QPRRVPGTRVLVQLGVADAGVSPGLRLPPRTCLMDRQRPARQARPLQPSNRGLRLRGLGHRHEAKAWGLAGLPLVENIAAVDHPIGREQLAELVCGRGRGEVTDKNPHGCLLLVSLVMRTAPLCRSLPPRPSWFAPGPTPILALAGLIHR